MVRTKSMFSSLLVAACLIVAGGGCLERERPGHCVEGARLITGDGAVIENSAFVVEGSRIVAAGRRADVLVPTGAARVDLTGKTVMPTMTDLHGHLGYQNVAGGTMSKDMFTRENLIDHLQRLAYHGVGAVVGIGDLVDRADGKGGRTSWGDLPLRMRDEIIPGAAMFRTSGAGMAYPGAGAQGHASRADVMYGVATPDEARAAVRDYVRIKPEFIKIWVDDRGGRKTTLTPPLYRALIEEAHKHNVPVGVHNVKLSDAKELLRAGVEGWLHVPVRGGDHVDEEIIAIVKNRIARNDRPKMWITPGLHTRLDECEPAEYAGRPAAGLARRSAAEGDLFAGVAPGELGRGASQEHHQPLHRARIRGAGPQRHAAARRRHAHRHGHRHRPEPALDRLFRPSWCWRALSASE